MVPRVLCRKTGRSRNPDQPGPVVVWQNYLPLDADTKHRALHEPGFYIVWPQPERRRRVRRRKSRLVV